MTPAAFTVGPNYVRAAAATRELHRLGREGENDSDAADAMRDEIDVVWPLLTDQERERLEGLSIDLQSFKYPREQPATVDPRGMQEVLEAVIVNHSGRPDEALAVIRRRDVDVPLGTLSYARAVCWFTLGDRESAMLFAENAVRLLPGDREAESLARTIRDQNPPVLFWRIEPIPIQVSTTS